MVFVKVKVKATRRSRMDLPDTRWFNNKSNIEIEKKVGVPVSSYPIDLLL